MPGGFPLGLEICNGRDGGADNTNTVPDSGLNVFCPSGSYTTIVSSTAADTCWILIYTANHGGNYSAVKLAVGAAASEQDIITGLLGNRNYQAWLLPISIPAGSRISAKPLDANSIRCSVRLFDGSFTQMEGCAGVDAVGYSSGNSGTALTPSGTANTKGSYIQLSASTPRDYMGFIVNFDNGASAGALGSTSYLVDIAIGGSGSEVVIVPDISIISSAVTGDLVGLTTLGPFYIPIPAGTRVAARIQASSTSVTTIGLTILGLYR